MENQHISGLFERIKARLSKQSVDRTLVVSAIRDLAKVELPEESIVIRKGVLVLSVTPLKRNQIMLKKQAILERIAVSAGATVHDIR